MPNKVPGGVKDTIDVALAKGMSPICSLQSAQDDTEAQRFHEMLLTDIHSASLTTAKRCRPPYLAFL